MPGDMLGLLTRSVILLVLVHSSLLEVHTIHYNTHSSIAVIHTRSAYFNDVVVVTMGIKGVC